MRVITDHIVSGDQAVQLRITVLDEPGQGGACHVYRIDNKPYGLIDGDSGYERPSDESDGIGSVVINFQNGPIKENGVNGVTQEALLAIVLDRLNSFQKGPYPSADNARAVFHVLQALRCLQSRTLARIARGVEGTTQQ